jgi:hypothetical protein
MRKKMKIIRTSMALMAIILITALAVESKEKQFNKNPEMATAFKELRTEMQNLYENDIYPNLKDWKSRLDNSMSSADLETLNKLRQEASSLRSSFRDKLRVQAQDGTCDGNGPKQNKECDGSGQGKGKGKGKCHGKENCCDGKMQENLTKVFTELKPLAEKYKSVLEDIGKTAEPMSTEWRDKAKTIAENWKENHKELLGDAAGKGREPRGPMMGMISGFDLSREHKAAMFMLWNGEVKSCGELFGDASQSTTMISSVDNLSDPKSGINNYPNPFTEKTTISFNLSKADKIKVYIVDNAGSVIETLYNGNLEAGDHSFTFNASGKNEKLPSGTYLYKIESSNSTKTGKMMLQR